MSSNLQKCSPLFSMIGYILTKNAISNSFFLILGLQNSVMDMIIFCTNHSNLFMHVCIACFMLSSHSFCVWLSHSTASCSVIISNTFFPSVFCQLMKCCHEQLTSIILVVSNVSKAQFLLSCICLLCFQVIFLTFFFDCCFNLHIPLPSMFMSSLFFCPST